MKIVKLQTESIDMGSLYAKLKAPEYGGIAIFLGSIREWTEGVHTDYIEYTAYEEMAIKELDKLATPIEAAGNRVIIVHRIGKLEIMDEALFIGVAAPHRKEALEGVSTIIETLKQTVPIWKKEVDQGENRWHQ